MITQREEIRQIQVALQLAFPHPDPGCMVMHFVAQPHDQVNVEDPVIRVLRQEWHARCGLLKISLGEMRIGEQGDAYTVLVGRAA